MMDMGDWRQRNQMAIETRCNFMTNGKRQVQSATKRALDVEPFTGMEGRKGGMQMGATMRDSMEAVMEAFQTAPAKKPRPTPSIVAPSRGRPKEARLQPLQITSPLSYSSSSSSTLSSCTLFMPAGVVTSGRGVRSTRRFLWYT